MRSRCLTFYLSGSEYDRLREEAKAEVRDPLQQARWILKQALTTDQREHADLPQRPPAVAKAAGGGS
ncbi:MAG: hypothetical protein M3008_08665 [Chloroflexota bacterium]|nr:hypothetical protein [Chloroflexota bacterium]